MTGATVTHAFTSPIADDATAAAKGEILPSHWNAAHTVTLSGVRTLLTAATTFYVRTDGADATGRGTADSAAAAYKTFQFAFNDIVANYDFGGQAVTIKAGNEAGTKTFAGIAYSGWTGGGSLVISGNGGTSTIFTDQTVFSGQGDFFSNSPLPGTVTYQNLTVGASAAATGINMVAPSVTIIGSGVIFSAQSGGVHVFMSSGASIILDGPYTLDTGSSLAHLNIGPDGTASDDGSTVITFNTGVSLSRGFLWLIGSECNFDSASAFTITGSFTGPDVRIETGGSLRYG